MADPNTIYKAIKAVVTVSKNEKIKKVISIIIIAKIAPFMITIIVLSGIFSLGTLHNKKTLELIFNDETIPKKMPGEQKSHIENTRKIFRDIDKILDNLYIEAEGEEIDRLRIKSIYYSLFNEETLDDEEMIKFLDSFVTYEDRTREVNEDTNKGDEEDLENDKNELGDNTQSEEDSETKEKVEEKYIAAIPISDISIIYKNIEEAMSISVNNTDMVNANEIYYRTRYGEPAPTEGDDFADWTAWQYDRDIDINENIASNEKGLEIKRLALTRLGHPYSQEKRGQGTYTDCSYLTLWAYRKIGINLPSTAAEQAKFCVNKKVVINKEDLEEGDLIFFSHKPNGRFMNITHVGIYAGNGKIIDASSSKGKVVHRDLFDANKQVLYARPYVIN